MNQNELVIKQAFEQPQWYLTKTAYNIKIRVETIREFVKALKTENILDIGCGDGSLSLHLLDESNQITLLDRSRSMLDIAQSRIPQSALHRVRTLNTDFMTAQLGGASFDLIICIGVLAYVEDRDLFIRKATALLKPGGTMIVECTDGRHFLTHIARGYAALRIAVLGDKFQTVSRPSSELLAIFAKLGFELRGSFRYGLPLPGLQRLLSQDMSYKGVRLLYGTVVHNRLAASMY